MASVTHRHETVHFTRITDLVMLQSHKTINMSFIVNKKLAPAAFITRAGRLNRG